MLKNNINDIVNEQQAIDNRENIKITLTQDTITLHTKLARSLWEGVKKPNRRIGFIQFAHLMTMLCEAKKADDPYAEWYLLKTYKEIDLAAKKLAELEKIADSYFDKLRGITVLIWQDKKPAKYPMQFTNKFSSITAYSILANADYVIRQILTLDQYGILLNQDTLSTMQVIKIVKSLFLTPIKWRNMNITRKDVIEDNEKAQRARAYFGILPEAVLHGKINLSIMPKTVTKEIVNE